MLDFLFIFGMFAPCIIRGAFWYDSPSPIGVVLIFAIFLFAGAIAWIAEMFDNHFGFAIIMALVIIAANIYAFKGSTFASSYSPDDQIDGDIDE